MMSKIRNISFFENGNLIIAIGNRRKIGLEILIFHAAYLPENTSSLVAICEVPMDGETRHSLSRDSNIVMILLDLKQGEKF